MVDSDVRLKRYRVVEELVLLAAPADQQIEYLNRTGWPRIEMVRGYLNWSYEMLLVLDRQGALSPEVVTATEALAQALFALDDDWTAEYKETGTIEALSENGVGMIRGGRLSVSLPSRRWRSSKRLVFRFRDSSTRSTTHVERTLPSCLADATDVAESVTEPVFGGTHTRTVEDRANRCQI